MKKTKTTKDGRNSKDKEEPVKKGSGIINNLRSRKATTPLMAKITKKPPTDEEV